MVIEEIKAQVLAKIKPTPEEERKIENIVQSLVTATRELGYVALPVGSIGKKTWLAGDHDIDLFVLFPKSVDREELEKRGLEIGKAIAQKLGGSTTVKYAEHPYTRAKIGEWNVDIVPCYEIKPGERPISAVDRSPLHLEYILKNLNPNLADEVRLVKQFMKGCKVYGSDARTQGFSGYLAELLVLKYGKFEDVLRAAAGWHASQVVDVQPLTNHVRLPNAPLIMPDPTDRKRNAAAAVSAENFMRFVKACRRFLEKPNIESFFPRPQLLSKDQIEILKDRGTAFLALVFERSDVIDDVWFPQLRRACKRIEKLLEEYEFKVLRMFEWSNGMAGLVFELEVWELPKIKRVIGPIIYSRKHTKEFLAKYTKPEFGPFVDGEKWFVERNREFSSAAELIKAFIKQSDLVGKGIPKYVAQKLSKAKLLDGAAFWKTVASNPTLSAELRRRYFERIC
jgi:tRNA nucleotidyltransferase (CCA-adding enzyme)